MPITCTVSMGMARAPVWTSGAKLVPAAGTGSRIPAVAMIICRMSPLTTSSCSKWRCIKFSQTT